MNAGIAQSFFSSATGSGVASPGLCKNCRWWRWKCFLRGGYLCGEGGYEGCLERVRFSWLIFVADSMKLKYYNTECGAE